MLEKEKDISVYSEEVQDVLSAPPKSIFRWGNTIMLGFVLIFGLLTYFIKYPDIITSEAVVTTQLPPQKLFSRTTAKFDTIFVKDNQEVKENQLIAILENSANYKDVLYLQSIMDSIPMDEDDFYFPIENLPILVLGDIDNAYAQFENAYMQYTLNKELRPFSYEVKAGVYTLNQLKSRLINLKSQYTLKQKELKLAHNDLKRNETLFEKGVISAQDFENKQLMYAQAQRDFKNFETTISQLKQSINDAKNNLTGTEIGQLKENKILLRQAIQAYNQLHKAIRDWSLRFVFQSNLNGRVTFLNIWHKNQNINQGDLVFTIIPKASKNYVARLKTPAQNSGKIKKGQKVNIKLNNYPDQEFGVLKGEIENMSLIPDQEGFYRIDVSMPNDLKTSYGKTLDFRQEMTGIAEIITEDLRLMERIFYRFRDLVNRN